MDQSIRFRYKFFPYFKLVLQLSVSIFCGKTRLSVWVKESEDFKLIQLILDAFIFTVTFIKHIKRKLMLGEELLSKITQKGMAYRSVCRKYLLEKFCCFDTLSNNFFSWGKKTFNTVLPYQKDRSKLRCLWKYRCHLVNCFFVILQNVIYMKHFFIMLLWEKPIVFIFVHAFIKNY